MAMPALLAVAPARAIAQTAPQIIVPSTPASKDGPRTLGGKAAVGKVMTRDELRACLKRLDEVNAGAKDLEQRRAALDQEKDGLSKSGEALKADRVALDAQEAGVREWESRVRALGTQIEAFNQRMKATEEAPRDKRDEMLKALEPERERLSQARKPLADDEARLVPAFKTAAAAYNEKAKARDALVDDWNGRNRAINEAAAKQEDERSKWLVECANRPYREDDEIAIKRGR
jgi:chromosome segregation ATPase